MPAGDPAVPRRGTWSASCSRTRSSRRASSCGRSSPSRCSRPPTSPRSCAAGLQAVPRGQVEAAQAVGLSPVKVMRLVVLPQALRAVIPAMVGQFISLFKDTSLLTIIGFFELIEVAEHRHPAARVPGPGPAAGHADVRRADLLGGLLDDVAREPTPRTTPGSGRAMTERSEVQKHSRPDVPTRRGRRRRRRVTATGGEGGDTDAAVGDELIRVRGRREVVRPLPGAAGHRPGGGPPGGRRRHRAVGLGEVDADPLHQPPRGARPRPHRGRRHRADQRRPPHRRGAARGRHGVPVVQPVPPPHGARQRDARAPQGAAVAEGAGRRGGPADARAGAASPSRPTSTPASCRAASSSGWRSPGRWRCSRRSCCSTSRPRPSTPR